MKKLSGWVLLALMTHSLLGCQCDGKEKAPAHEAAGQGSHRSGLDSLPWRVHRSEHYRIETLVDSIPSQALLERVESLYKAYFLAFDLLPPRHASVMNLRLYRDRHEMHAFESMPEWAEGYYAQGWCIQYLRPNVANPWHWAIHEATHQLHAERAQLELPRWLNEGLACLFSCSRMDSSGLHLGTVDPESYPAWWLKDYRPTGNRKADLRAGKVQSLETIVRGGGAQPEAGDLNLSYLSWWTVTRFLWSRDPVRFLAWARRDRTIEGLERIVGPLQSLEIPYYQSLLRLTDSVVVPK